MAGDAPALAFGGSAPDAMVDVIHHCVLEARLFDWAVRADPPRHFNAHSIARKERIRRHLPALSPTHPRSVHNTIVTCPAAHCYAKRNIRSKP